MNRRTTVALHAPLALALLIVFGAVGWLAGSEAGPPSVIRIGFAAIGIGGVQAVGYSPIGSAQMLGLLDAEFAPDQIKIEWNFFRGAGPAINEAIANGQLDFAWQGDLPAIIGRSNGLPTRIILASGVRGNSYLAVPADSPATALEDLKGKRVALHKGTNLQLVVAKVLDEHGLSERDFQSVNLDTLSGVPAITAHELDGLWGGIELIALERAGTIRFVYSTRGKSPTVTRQAHLLVTEGFSTQHPDLVQRLVTVLVRRAAYESDEGNRAELFQLWSRMGLPESTWQGDFSESRLDERQTPLLDPFFIARYQEAVTQAQEFKLLRGQVNLNAWIDRSYLDKALSDLHLKGRWPERDAQGQPLGERRP
jgi:sulfonate transport system substrate-binding protein